MGMFDSLKKYLDLGHASVALVEAIGDLAKKGLKGLDGKTAISALSAIVGVVEKISSSHAAGTLNVAEVLADIDKLKGSLAANDETVDADIDEQFPTGNEPP